jgi:hypothetical protein
LNGFFNKRIRFSKPTYSNQKEKVIIFFKIMPDVLTKAYSVIPLLASSKTSDTVPLASFHGYLCIYPLKKTEEHILQLRL